MTLSACGPDYAYQKTYAIDGANWTYADSLKFEFEVNDTSDVYNLWLTVDHNIDYEFQNLYINIRTKFPSGSQLAEPLSLELANRIGQWYGKCNNSYCHLRIPIQEGAFFNQTGKYEITLDQYMRQNPVAGIRNIGFLLEKTDQSR